MVFHFIFWLFDIPFFFSFLSFPFYLLIVILFYCRWLKWPVLIHVCKLCVWTWPDLIFVPKCWEWTNQHIPFWCYASCINCVLLTLFGSVWFIWTSCHCYYCLSYSVLFIFIFARTTHLFYISCEICLSIDYLFMIASWIWVVSV